MNGVETGATNRQMPTRRLVLGGGLVSLASWLASYRPTPDPSWTRMATTAPWPRRDSAGLIVHEERIWLIGGAGENQKGLADCWSSADGFSWTKDLNEGPWSPTVHSMVASFSGRLWRMGGFLQDGNAFVPVDDIWSSQDGRRWFRANTQPEWSPRGGGTLVAFGGRLWLLGGTQGLRNEGLQPNFNDVWSTYDGVTWTSVLQNAPWQPRAFHNAVVHDGQLWILGGGYWSSQPRFFRDVWCSPDGVSWERKTMTAEWPGRLWAASASFHGLLWTMGGLVQREASNDIWYSKDGKIWHSYLAKKVWNSRKAHSVLPFSDKLWVLAGSKADHLNKDDPLNDIWTLALPADWTGDGFLNRMSRLFR